MLYCGICEHFREGTVFTPFRKKYLSSSYPYPMFLGILPWEIDTCKKVLIVKPRSKHSLICQFVHLFVCFKITSGYRQLLKDRYLSFSLFLPEFFLISRYTSWNKLSSTEEIVCHHCEQYSTDSGRRMTVEALVGLCGIRSKTKRLRCVPVYMACWKLL